MRVPAWLTPRQLPWLYLGAAAIALVIQLNPEWREALLYNRAGIANGEYWRIWTGHWVHFGWEHFIPDTGLFLILGWLLQTHHAWFSRLSLVLMTLWVSAAIYWFEPSMARYGGLSAIDLGMLLYLAGQGWQKRWTDWFWPAVIAIYIGEVIFEIKSGGEGGGMIKFDDPHVKVASGAHIAAAAYAMLAWLLARVMAARKPSIPIVK